MLLSAATATAREWAPLAGVFSAREINHSERET
jgi:hypothetical protein